MEEINEKQNIEIAKISKDIEWLKCEIRDIKENHLESIYDKLDAQTKWIIALLTSAVLTLFGLALNLFFK